MLIQDSRWDRRFWRTVAGRGRLYALPAVLLAVASWVQMALRVIRHEARKEGSYLVPVRAFIGIGWLRAFAEKAVEPGWRDGTSLSDFLAHQLQAEVVAFPSYQALMNDLFLPHAALLGWLIVLGQVLAGVAVLSGSLTNAALLGGILMNLNFLLAGVPDPSAFYIVIQMVLLLAGTGAIFGIDARLSAQNRSPLFAARTGSPLSNLPIAHAKALALVTLALLSAVYATLQIKDWTPGGSVHDPAAILAVLAVMTASWIAIAALRGGDALPAH